MKDRVMPWFDKVSHLFEKMGWAEYITTGCPEVTWSRQAFDLDPCSTAEHGRKTKLEVRSLIVFVVWFHSRGLSLLLSAIISFPDLRS